jgi:ABC-type amino acid transport system permease subunit
MRWKSSAPASRPRPGQIEAAQALALKRWQIFLHVVLRPALLRKWPAMASQVVIVMLGSAVCAQISTEELSYAASLIQIAQFPRL